MYVSSYASLFWSSHYFFLSHTLHERLYFATFLRRVLNVVIVHFKILLLLEAILLISSSILLVRLFCCCFLSEDSFCSFRMAIDNSNNLAAVLLTARLKVLLLLWFVG